MRLTKTIIAKVTKADAKKAGPYSANCGCLFYQTLHRLFPRSVIRVGGTSARIGKKDYYLGKGREGIVDSYDDTFTSASTFKPFSVTLTLETDDYPFSRPNS